LQARGAPLTILNAYADNDRLLVVAYTESVATAVGHGPVTINTSKLFALPDVNAILGGRGSLLWLSIVHNGVLFVGDDLDAMIGAMPALLDATFSGRSDAMRDIAAEQTILLAGWSPKRARMVVYTFDQGADADGFKPTEHPVPGCLLMPWQSGWGAPGDVSTVSGMVSTAKLQRDCVRREFGRTAAAGGRLICATVTPDGMALHTAHDFGDG
jgi:hypothetical protein